MHSGVKILLGLIALIVLGVLGIHVPVLGPSASGLESRLAVAVESALAADGHDWPGVRMDGQRAALIGIAPSREALEAARRTASRAVSIGGPVAGGVTGVNIGETDIMPRSDAGLPIARPFVLTLRRDGGALTMEGFVPGEELARRLSALGAVGVVQSARGVPDEGWARLALLAAAALPDGGTATLSDRSLVLTGVWGEDARARVLAGLPVGYEAVLR